MNNENEFNWCEVPFNMLVTGASDCGKTYYIMNLLEKEFKNKFHHVVILCPTIEYNRTYQERDFINKDKNIYTYPPKLVQENLNGCLEDCINEFKSQDSQTLFIVDDCANLWDTKTKCSRLTELAFSGRHINISVWLLTQKYNAICKDFRENIKHLVIHALNDQNALDQIFKENRCLPHSEKEAAIAHLDAGGKLLLRKNLPFGFYFFINK